MQKSHDGSDIHQITEILQGMTAMLYHYNDTGVVLVVLTYRLLFIIMHHGLHEIHLYGPNWMGILGNW